MLEDTSTMKTGNYMYHLTVGLSLGNNSFEDVTLAVALTAVILCGFAGTLAAVILCVFAGALTAVIFCVFAGALTTFIFCVFAGVLTAVIGCVFAVPRLATSKRLSLTNIFRAPQRRNHCSIK